VRLDGDQPGPFERNMLDHSQDGHRPSLAESVS
jgi:hypothetical protein